jgi:hypothetical protein
MAQARTIPTPRQLHLKTRSLLSAAASALAGPVAHAAAFKDARSFKASLIKTLGAHPEFDQATRELHGLHQGPAQAKAPRGGNQIPVTIRPSGRTQATRYEPSQGQQDRQRGWRDKGGKREGRRTYKGPS